MEQVKYRKNKAIQFGNINKEVISDRKVLTYTVIEDTQRSHYENVDKLDLLKHSIQEGNMVRLFFFCLFKIMNGVQMERIGDTV